LTFPPEIVFLAWWLFFSGYAIIILPPAGRRITEVVTHRFTRRIL